MRIVEMECLNTFAAFSGFEAHGASDSIEWIIRGVRHQGLVYPDS